MGGGPELFFERDEEVGTGRKFRRRGARRECQPVWGRARPVELQDKVEDRRLRNAGRLPSTPQAVR